LDSRMLPLRGMLADLFDAFDGAPRPFLLKCSGGQDRTSFAAALFLVHRNGWRARDVALAQFSPDYWHFPKRHQHWLRHFLVYAESETNGTPLGEWARTRYEPEAFAQWLAVKNLGDSFKKIFVPY